MNHPRVLWQRSSALASSMARGPPEVRHRPVVALLGRLEIEQARNQAILWRSS